MHGKPAGWHENTFASGAGLEGGFDLFVRQPPRHVITIWGGGCSMRDTNIRSAASEGLPGGEACDRFGVV